MSTIIKRSFLLFLCLCFSLTAFSACNRGGNGEAVRLGVGAVSRADDTDFELDTTVCAVTLGSDGKIKACRADVAQCKATVSETGEITLPEQYQTKMELGDAYGMKKASPIGKEWYEQANAFCDFVVGKTAAQLTGLYDSGTGKATDSALSSVCSIKIDDLTAAVVKACENAEEGGANASHTLTLGIVTEDNDSASASAEAGSYAVTTTFVAATVSDGKITAVFTDAVQPKQSFDNTGKNTADTLTFRTKRELGDEYGMKKASPIGKEWYEQAAAFSDFAVGKTSAQLSGLYDSGTGKSTDSALSAVCSIKIDGFCRALTKGMAQ